MDYSNHYAHLTLYGKDAKTRKLARIILAYLAIQAHRQKEFEQQWARGDKWRGDEFTHHQLVKEVEKKPFRLSMFLNCLMP